MRKPIPTRRFFEGVKGQMTFRDQLSELSGSLKDIGIFAEPVLDGLTAAH